MDMGDFDLVANLQLLSISIIPLVAAVVLHEYAHGYIAHKWGDDTAKDAGRLTMNPVPHIDPVGTVLFPVILMLSGINVLFGWAKPVPIDPRQFRKTRPGLFFVSIAGVTMNFFLAIFSALLFAAVLAWVPEDFYLFKPLVEMAKFSVMINFALGIFNLIPLPPLDGSKVVESFLPPKAILQYEKVARFSMVILLVALFTGAFRYLMVPIRFASEMTLTGAALLFGLL